MLKIILSLMIIFTIVPLSLTAAQPFEKDLIKTSAGDLEITFIGHGTLVLKFNDLIIHVDPYGRLAEYSALPKADLILITHHHRDHLDNDTLKKITTDQTTYLLTALAHKKVKRGIIMKNGDKQDINRIKIEAIPAYNLVHKRGNGALYHPRGEGNGYVLTFGNKRVYIAGDTENTPEMKALKGIDIAFLPMNLPYTMTPEMVADAAKAFKPKILYPYHYGKTKVSDLLNLLKSTPEIEIRVRKME